MIRLRHHRRGHVLGAEVAVFLKEGDQRRRDAQDGVRSKPLEPVLQLLATALDKVLVVAATQNVLLRARRDEVPTVGVEELVRQRHEVAKAAAYDDRMSCGGAAEGGDGAGGGHLVRHEGAVHEATSARVHALQRLRHRYLEGAARRRARLLGDLQLLHLARESLDLLLRHVHALEGGGGLVGRRGGRCSRNLRDGSRRVQGHLLDGLRQRHRRRGLSHGFTDGVVDLGRRMVVVGLQLGRLVEQRGLAQRAAQYRGRRRILLVVGVQHGAHTLLCW
mmetsp:Transcript_4129/g.14782  ORF Transcript_4129/g.14782 Transcript_4129/m.14782 type:complete len:277 (-) Transcript_4129:257-1087(-)